MHVIGPNTPSDLVRNVVVSIFSLPTEGWERFKEELERDENVDFWSLDRAPVV